VCTDVLTCNRSRTALRGNRHIPSRSLASEFVCNNLTHAKSPFAEPLADEKSENVPPSVVVVNVTEPVKALK